MTIDPVAFIGILGLAVCFAAVTFAPAILLMVEERAERPETEAKTDAPPVE